MTFVKNLNKHFEQTFNLFVVIKISNYTIQTQRRHRKFWHETLDGAVLKYKPIGHNSDNNNELDASGC